MAASSSENVVSIRDVYNSQLHAQRLAESLSKKLECCTYEKGSITQPVFTCSTCHPVGTPPAALCASCAFDCHADHDLIELYSKRNIQCDCDRYQCRLWPAKPIANENVYNHNYAGLYCYCDGKYDEGNDTMVQCIACEDWFHDRCLARQVDPDTYQSMLCKNCVASTTRVLSPYRALLRLDNPGALSDTTRPDSGSSINASSDASHTATAAGPTVACIRPVATPQAGEPAKSNESESLEEMYLPADWRTKVCHCADCLQLYKLHKLWFLLESEEEYERSLQAVAELVENESDGEHDAASGAGTAPASPSSPAPDAAAPSRRLANGNGSASGAAQTQEFDIEAIALRAMAKFPAAPMLDVAGKLTRFLEQIKEGLRPLAEQGRVVTAEDVAEIVQAQKRRKLESDEAGADEVDAAE